METTFGAIPAPEYSSANQIYVGVIYLGDTVVWKDTNTALDMAEATQNAEDYYIKAVTRMLSKIYVF